MSNLSKLFETEVSLVRDPEIRNLTNYILDNKVPEYFKELPSSSSGKYHPLNKNGEPENLIEHTKSVVRILYCMISHPMITLSQYEKDCLIVSAILHDSVKYGYPEPQEHTVHEHPVLLRALIDDVILGNESWSTAFSSVIDYVSSHHGPWRTNRRSDVNLPPIVSDGQWYLHLADYLGSRVYIRVDYDHTQL